MPKPAAHTRWWQIFEIVVGLPVLVAVSLQIVRPFSLPQGRLTPLAVPLGVLLVLIGVALIVLARRTLARHGQPTDPGQPTRQIVTTGVFAISRNPLYLGGFILLAGAGLALDALWLLLLLVPALVTCHVVLIVPEERYLAATFGADYLRYAAGVRRWLGRRRPKRANG